ncbi:nuclear transport factor 2-like [Punica granatum]|uniref:Uncharacterized protein n=2 Tax=Punica granatum TaxID=22663 RepID=A0A218WTN7_PUNGR|nr:nuclear transport factor 2-like [Punica granatum]OWM75888.1 hypothetical protein CDL15_Pgr009532 [Punica granatum]PKI44424.1 hypothetical protein CRG98_035156 [Punica granatum]
MAAQANGHPAEPDPMEVGNAFVKQYYPMLISSPDHVHKFYREGSEVSRPGPNGEMTSVTTMQAINEKILSLKYDKYKAEIATADAQASFEGGVSVLVTGILTGEDAVRRMFTQFFFLAPQDTGYYVLNDMFRYVEGISATPISILPSGDIVEAPEAPAIPEPEVCEKSAVENVPVPVPVKEDLPNGKESTSVVEHGKDPVTVKEIVIESPAESSPNDASYPATVASPPVVQGDGTKKSFASIVNALKNNSAPFHVRASPVKVVEKPRAPAAAPEAPVQPIPNGNSAAEKISSPAVKRHSIFVGNLPLDATPAQLEGAFKKFGAIKRNGIQVRSSKGSCYGFVEFESESSVRAALEESSILIGHRTAHIEEQKNDGGDKGRAPQGRGGFRNDNFRGRGNYNGSRGYGRNEFDKKFEYRNGRNGGAYNREYQNSSGRTPRQVVKE